MARKLREKMMAAEIPGMKRVYLTDEKINRKSMVHTIYYGTNGDKPNTPEYTQGSISFWGGISRNMPKQTFDQLKKLGHVTTDRPRRNRGGDEDDD
jgi:hypothetical protein